MTSHTPDRSGQEPYTVVTPSMAQYIEIKAANPDCLLFYRMGDFYELFFEDAEIASRTLGIVLTKRGKHGGQDIPMCGVPIARSDDYLQRLIAAGHRVAVCEQLEDPAEARKRGSKAVVRRDVVRLVTAGTITEESLLDPARSSVLLAVARIRRDEVAYEYGLAGIDITTGRFDLLQVDEARLAAEVARIDPREIVLPEAVREDPALKAMWADTRAALTTLPAIDSAGAGEQVAAFFGVATLDGFGALNRAEVAAAALALRYIERTQRGQRPALSPPSRAADGNRMQIDAATRTNLELTRTMAGDRAGSLLGCIDCTVTPAGSRLLAERLAGPLTDLPTIVQRHDAVAALVERPELRRDLREVLRRAPDMPRALARLALGRGGPRDLAAVRAGLVIADALVALLQPPATAPYPDEIAQAERALARAPATLAEQLAAALADDLPLNKRDGSFVRTGFEAALDEARGLRDDSRRVIAGLQNQYAALADARTLRIKYNNFLGYFVEVPQKDGERLLTEPLNATFIHRQTMAGAMRYSTAELSQLEAKIASAGDRALQIELGIFDRLAGASLDSAPAIKAAAEALATLDVTAALAELAASRTWVRPQVNDSLRFDIEGGRHPVVEEAVRRSGQAFIANDCDLSPPETADHGRVLLITGPNMAGKSTYLRQNALIAVLAQMGAFVPATRASIGIVDRLFSRVGAADDLARGRSTFMVEMVETAAILNQAGPRALVILDEIGRGTATFDGLSIAWAAIEHLHDGNRTRALFATHFHELTALSKRLPRLSNVTMRVTEHAGDVVFLHEVVSGTADRSYGIQVAKLAGLPAAVTERARVILAELEQSDRQAPVHRLLDDLPLFAAARPVASPPPVPSRADPLRAALDAINPDEMTPREALDALYRLKLAVARPSTT